MRPRTLLTLLVSLAAGAFAVSVPHTLEVREGDHLSLIGTTLAERLQHFNHGESLLHQHFPQHQIVVRSLARPADEVVLRPRSEGFGDPDQHLTFS